MLAMFAWPDAPGCGWMRRHELALTEMACMRLDGLPHWQAQNLLFRIRQGEQPGLVCSRCGMTMTELLRWPGALCLERPRVADRNLYGPGRMGVPDDLLKLQSS